MADIQLIQYKNQHKTSSNRRNVSFCNKIGVKESNAGVRIFSCLCMRLKTWVKCRED